MNNKISIEEVKSIYDTPLLDLIFKASYVHRQQERYAEVQLCTLISIKTGGCPEDCSYCPQSIKYNTDLKVEPMMSVQEVLEKAKIAKKNGSTRFCMGAAWREVRNNRDFDKVLEMVEGVNDLEMEVCCTLGMLTQEQAEKLKQAGLFAYNHNLDTSKEYYEKIITTRTYEERLQTIENVRKAGISVCCGGIVGLGETHEDRIKMLFTLATLTQHPESVPINALVRVKGTPLQNHSKVDIWDLVRMIATARILMPKSMVRLSAGRVDLTLAEQTLCFIAGANSIFSGEKLLTTPNPDVSQDEEMFKILGLTPRIAFKEEKVH